MGPFAHGDHPAAIAHGFHLTGGDHAEFAQASLHNAECVLVDQADLAQAKLALGELEPAGPAGVRERSPMHAEASRPVKFAEQPQGDLIETAHAPADALVVVDRVERYRAGIGRQLVRHQASRPSAVKQLAQTEIKAKSFLRTFEAGLVFVKHGSPIRGKDYEPERSAWATGPIRPLSHLREQRCYSSGTRNLNRTNATRIPMK